MISVPVAAACLFAAMAVVGVLAQLVERLVRNEKVRGSNPLDSTSHRCFLLFQVPVSLFFKFLISCWM